MRTQEESMSFHELPDKEKVKYLLLQIKATDKALSDSQKELEELKEVSLTDEKKTYYTKEIMHLQNKLQVKNKLTEQLFLVTQENEQLKKEIERITNTNNLYKARYELSLLNKNTSTFDQELQRHNESKINSLLKGKESLQKELALVRAECKEYKRKLHIL